MVLRRIEWRNYQECQGIVLKFRSISLLLLAEVAAMSLWFVSAAILPEMVR